MNSRLTLSLAALVVCGACHCGSSPVSDAGTPMLLSITLDPAAVSVAVGDTVKLTATGHFSDSTDADLTAGVSWSSSDATLAEAVAGTPGSVRGVALGTATITATDATTGISATASVA